MGKPRMIILIRHAQSEGNQNRAIHQTVPDHRVKLTPHGLEQAREAGRRLRSMLRPDDTLQFYTSPYRRTRETTEGILSTLTSDDDAPTPFPRHTIKVWEEPRLREQDFGNFQPCSAAMERMWQERADYGHFFYRIPHGESAADAYDRVSGFNETLWRSFNEDDFPSVCVLVTHGLMTRVFLMKWYHWGVEYFEDLRNVNHCEFIIMKRSRDSGKYILQNQLRTWSDLKKQAAKEKGEEYKPPPRDQIDTDVSKRHWGGCPEGCTHEHEKSQYASIPKRKHTVGPTFAAANIKPAANPPANRAATSGSINAVSAERVIVTEEDEEAFPEPPATSRLDTTSIHQRILTHNHSGATWHEGGRDFGGSASGAPTPYLSENDERVDYGFPSPRSAATGPYASPVMHLKHLSLDNSDSSDDGRRRRDPSKTPTAEQEAKWVRESGMGIGAQADALGDTEGHEMTVEELESEERQDKSLRGSVY